MEEQDAIARLRRGDIGGLEAVVRCYQVQAVRVADLIVRDRALPDSPPVLGGCLVGGIGLSP